MSITSHWNRYVERTAKRLGESIVKVVKMQGADAPNRAPRTLFTFNSADDIAQYATGCDGDIGGRSTVHLDLDENPARNATIGKKATGVFWGEMRLDVKPGYESKIRGGYAGFRNKNRPTLFGDLVDDVSMYEYLALRVRLGGDPRTRNSYYVNVTTDGPVSGDLWQHRLYFRRNDGNWEDIYLPFDNFVRTNAGQMSKDQLEMMRERVKSIGISILGGNSGVSGKYELGIDSIRVVNEEDVTHEPLGADAHSHSTSDAAIVEFASDGIPKYLDPSGQAGGIVRTLDGEKNAAETAPVDEKTPSSQA